MTARYTHMNLLQAEDAAPELGLDEWQESRFVTSDLDAVETGPEGLELLAFGTRHEGDAEFVQDWWT